MNLEQYQKETIRTFAFRKEDLSIETTDMLHCAIGVSTEVAELVNAINVDDLVNIGEEIADQMWYISNLATFINIDMHKECLLLNKKETQNKYFCVNRSCVLAGNLLDIFKRKVYYNKDIDNTILAKLLFDMTQNLYDLCSAVKLDFEQILENNIAKLRVRFPDKFTNELAENRDLSSERKELEK